ncbi:MAG: hypothetical protein QOF83_3454 [Solirubrobacteraceae bacterium]|jgi:hypothetical protein|nr:hypothetical protein [Solirubrobacteraceae bacterium]
MNNGVSNQFTGDQDHVITRRAKFAELAERHADNPGSSAPTLHLQRQKLAGGL